MSENKQEKILTTCVPIPICVINSQGKVVDANKYIGDVFIYDAIIDADILHLQG